MAGYPAIQFRMEKCGRPDAMLCGGSIMDLFGGLRVRMLKKHLRNLDPTPYKPSPQTLNPRS